MSKYILLIVPILACLVVQVPLGYCQRGGSQPAVPSPFDTIGPRNPRRPLNVVTRERIIFGQKEFLREVLEDNVDTGRRMVRAAEVERLIGPPERVRRDRDARGPVEIWEYADIGARLEFRNDAVSTWFVRFSQGKREREVRGVAGNPGRRR